MTSSLERPAVWTRRGRESGATVGPAERNRRAGIRLDGTVFCDGPIHLASSCPSLGLVRRRSRQSPRVDSRLDECRRGPRRSLDMGQRRRRRPHDGRRVPERNLEQIVEGAPFLDANAEVGLAVFDVQLRRRLQQGRSHAIQGNQRRLLRRRRLSGDCDQQTRDAGRTEAHAVRTSWSSFRPVQGVAHGIFA